MECLLPVVRGVGSWIDAVGRGVDVDHQHVEPTARRRTSHDGDSIRPGVYGRFTISCFHASGRSANGGTFYYTIEDPVPVEQLRAEAKAEVIIPDPVIDSNPSFNDRFTIVRIPTWLWVDAGYWNGRYDGDSSAGFVTVEVWAEPVDLRWEFAGGEWVAECGDQPGTPWVPGAADTDCSVEFTRSSAGQPGDAFSGTATVFWQFRWSLNGADQGPFDELFEATTPFEIQVGEIQAVES